MRQSRSSRCLRSLLGACAILSGTVYLVIPDHTAERYHLFDVACSAMLLVAAAACWWRARNSDHGRAAWRRQSVALVLYLGGDLSARTGFSSSWPGLSDVLWLSFYVLTAVSVTLHILGEPRKDKMTPWVDGGIAGTAVLAVVTTVWLRSSFTIDEATWSTLVNLAYPTADFVLAVLLAVLFSASLRPDRSLSLLWAGMICFFVADIAYLHQVAEGQWVRGGAIQVLWPVGVGLIGLAAATSPASPDKEQEVPRYEHVTHLFFVLLAAGVLAFGHLQEIPTVAFCLSLASLALALLRSFTALRDLRELPLTRSEARTDSLTGLPNRRAFWEALRLAPFFGTSTFALLVLDLNRFKEINDSLGHLPADELLAAVAARLSTAIPEGAFLARIGGDEFAVIIPEAGDETGTAVAESITRALDVTFPVESMNIPIRASIGVACHPSHAQTPSELLACADIAMYQAKSRRVPSSIFSVAADNPSRDRVALLADLGQAVEEGQFTLHFQPQIDTRTGAVIGAEALVRWQHPERGLLQPAPFIDLLEYSGVMSQATISIIDEALGAIAELRERGWGGLRVSVNVSGSDASRAILPSLVLQLLDRHHTAAQDLTIEVTESSVISNLETARTVLGDLRRSGIRVSIDDFGTGHASFEYLRGLPADEIKIDRSFVGELPADQCSRAIARSVILLGKELGLGVVAEGVEDAATLDWLIEHGCETAQGYHFARPLPFDDFVDWLVDRTAQESAPLRAPIYRVARSDVIAATAESMDTGAQPLRTASATT